MTMVINGSGSITGLSAGGLPDGTIQQADLATGVAGTGPAFRAYQSSNQTLNNNAYSKITLTTEVFDTNSNYDTSTSRFTPTVAGYYFVAGTATAVTTSTSDQLGAYIFKNGSNALQGTATTGLTNFYPSAAVSGFFYMNGSTDYVELYIYLGSSASKTSVADAASTIFSASLVRAA